LRTIGMAVRDEGILAQTQDGRTGSIPGTLAFENYLSS
jgi:hypothetical protein